MNQNQEPQFPMVSCEVGIRGIGEVLADIEDDLAEIGEGKTLKFLNGGRWLGNLTMIRTDDQECEVKGTLFPGGEEGISLWFTMGRNGPIAFMQEEPGLSNDEVIASLYGEGGVRWTKEEAKAVPLGAYSSEQKQMYKGAKAALSAWLKDKECSCQGGCQKCRGRGKLTNQPLRDKVFAKVETPEAPKPTRSQALAQKAVSTQTIAKDVKRSFGKFRK